MALEWYFLRVQVGREDRIRENMILRLKQAGLEDKVPEIIVPKETVADHRGGKRRIQKRKLFPGYLMVQMDLVDDVWFVFRETPGFGDFVGANSSPTPMTEEEVENVRAKTDSSREQPRMSVSYSKGDRVKIKKGAFENMDAAVEEVCPQKGTLEVTVNIFGRATPMTLGYWEVEPV